MIASLISMPRTAPAQAAIADGVVMTAVIAGETAFSAAFSAYHPRRLNPSLAPRRGSGGTMVT
jgi:hypothetical protein